MAGGKDSKLAYALREKHRVFNNHDLLLSFGRHKDVAVEYTQGDSRACSVNHTSVYSPRFKTDPFAPHYGDGCKWFVGKKHDSMPLAMAWAASQYHIHHWAPSPFGGYVPQHVMERARAAVKE